MDPVSKQKGDGIEIAWDEGISSKPADVVEGEVTFIWCPECNDDDVVVVIVVDVDVDDSCASGMRFNS